MKKKKLTISDLDGFEDICNEKELFSVNAGCSSDNKPIGPTGPGPIPNPGHYGKQS